MQNFRLKGIAHPGRVNLFRIGTVELANISDELAEKIWREGCQYLEPTPEYNRILFPDRIPIEVKPIITEAQIVPATVKPAKGTRKSRTKK
jgi:hypothetical protein